LNVTTGLFISIMLHWLSNIICFGGQTLRGLDRDQLGCPNYSEGHGYAGHAGMFRELGKTGNERLIQGGRLSFRARDGGDPFDALLADFDEVILPALRQSPDKFSEALARDHRKFQDELGGVSG
jgi:hypothetical protein